jgi:selenocysteine lyase/cysteine desulfurase
MAFNDLFRSVDLALEHYSNVHRGSGHHSQVSTRLYEEARTIVLRHLRLSEKQFTVIFCSAGRSEKLIHSIGEKHCRKVSSGEFGLPLGVTAVAIKNRNLPRGVPYETGGGTTKLYDKEWVIWADAPDRFEAGTPAIINVIAFARALLMVEKGGSDIFRKEKAEKVEPSMLFNDSFSKLSGSGLLKKLQDCQPGLRPEVPFAGGKKTYINLDNSASTPTFDPIAEVFKKALQQPEENHEPIIREVKKIISDFLTAPEDLFDIIFTSNTTESVNLLASKLPEPEPGDTPLILNTMLEHSSNDLPWRYIPGYKVVKLPVSHEGFWDTAKLEEILRAHNGPEDSRNRIRVVTVSGASNVLGSCNDLAVTAALVHQYGALFVVDAAQLVAHRAIDMTAEGIDGLVFSAHKAYAPFGTGVLVIRKNAFGVGFSAGDLLKSGGEENIGGIVALGKALMLIRSIGFDVIRDEEVRLTRRAIQGMMNLPGLQIKGISDPDSPNMERKTGIILFEIKNRMPGRVATRLAWHGAIGVRYGCHCAHLIIKQLTGFTPFQEHFQRIILLLFPMLKLQGFLRVSFGLGNREEDVDQMISVLGKIVRNQLTPKSRLRDIHQQIAEYSNEMSARCF